MTRTLLIYSKISRLLAGGCLVFFLLTYGLHPNATAQEAEPGVGIPASAFMVVDLLPKSAIAQPTFEPLPRELIKVFGEKELGINLLELKRATVVVDEITDPEMQEPPGFGVIVEFDSPQTLAPKILEETEPTTFHGKQAYSLGGQAPLLVILSDRKMLIGMEPFLEKMVAAKGADSSLLTKLRTMPAEDHMKIVVALDPVRELIKQNLPPKNEVPPPFAEYLVLPDLIKSITYRGNFSTSEVSELVVEAIDEKNAEKIVRMVNNALELAKGAVLSGIASEMALSDPDYEAAAIAYADRITEWLQVNMKPEMDGSKLVYDLRGLTSGGNGAASLSTIGVLVAMLLPAVQQVREAARRASSMNNLRMFAMAAMNYESTFKKLPMQANYNAEGKPLLSWRVHLLPFLEERALYEQFNLDEPWDSEHNIQLLDRMPAVFANPNVPTENKTVFLAVSGTGTVFPGNQKVGYADILDGNTNTAMFLEADAEMAVEWTRPQDWTLNEADPLRGLGNLRPSGFNVAFCDGSVRFISRFIDPETWKSIVNKADGNSTLDY